MPRLRHPFDTRPVHCRLRHCLITFPLLRLRDFSRFLLTASPPPSRMFQKLLGTASQSQVTRRKQQPHGHYLPSQTGYQECSESFWSPDFCVNQWSLFLKEEQTLQHPCVCLCDWKQEFFFFWWPNILTKVLQFLSCTLSKEWLFWSPENLWIAAGLKICVPLSSCVSVLPPIEAFVYLVPTQLREISFYS